MLGPRIYEQVAETMHRWTLTRTEKVLGHKHPDMLTSINNLALIPNNQEGA
ncbi:hypothetical protein PTT_12644 [Pyrenophora teres f. teres 0-1]|uniref:Uncharacterized protein n=1 Tax=Pyrenophora teres f. teres (strain 0-1) TaxID=861557 RepID=E3RU94_PYRTT|nr:hypothetical protein PTT_12644 [Pyrenophora teres f. teres 0-1]